MRRLILLLLLVCGLAAPAAGQARVQGTSATGAPVPIGAAGNSLKVSGFCESAVAINQSSATTTELVALTSGQSIYICGWEINVIGVAGPATWKFSYGTGTNCGTGTTDLGGTHTSTTNTAAIEHFDYAAGTGYALKPPVSNAVCITTTTTTPQRGTLFYTKF